MAAQAPTKQPFQPVSETRRAFPIRGNTWRLFQRYLLFPDDPRGRRGRSWSGANRPRSGRSWILSDDPYKILGARIVRV